MTTHYDTPEHAANEHAANKHAANKHAANKDGRALKLLRGGLAEPLPVEPDWQAFCASIGWQQLGEPSLPDNYEEQLVSRIFGGGEAAVVHIHTGLADDIHTGLADDSGYDIGDDISASKDGWQDVAPPEDHTYLGVDAEDDAGPTAGASADATTSPALDVTWWATVAVAAIIGIACATMLAWSDAPAALRQLPTPVQEQRQAPAPPPVREAVAPEPTAPEELREPFEQPRDTVGPDEAAPQSPPDPGARRAQRVYASVAPPPAVPESAAEAPDAVQMPLLRHALGIAETHARVAAVFDPALFDPQGGELLGSHAPMALASLSPALLADMSEGRRSALGLEAPEAVAASDVPAGHAPWRAVGGWYGVGMSAPRDEATIPAGVRVMARVDVIAAGRQLF